MAPLGTVFPEWETVDVLITVCILVIAVVDDDWVERDDGIVVAVVFSALAVDDDAHGVHVELFVQEQSCSLVGKTSEKIIW